MNMQDNQNEEINEMVEEETAQQDIIASGIDIDPEDIEEMSGLADRLSDNDDINELKFEEE